MAEYTYLVSPDYEPSSIPEGYIWDETAFQELVKATDKATADQTIYAYGGEQGNNYVDYENAADLTISNQKYNYSEQVVDTTITANTFNNTGTVKTDGAIAFSVQNFSNFGEFNLDKDGYVAAAGVAMNMATGTINLNAGSTLEGTAVGNAGTITIVSDHATINGAVTNNGLIDALMKKLIVIGELQNANYDESKVQRDKSIIRAREFEVTGNVVNYGIIGEESREIHTLDISGALSNYFQILVDIMTVDSIENNSISSPDIEKCTRGYIVAGEVNAGSLDNVFGIIQTSLAKEDGIGLSVTGTINNGNADNNVAEINAGLNGWIQAASLNNIGTDIEKSLVKTGKLTVGDVVNNGGISTRIIESTGTITNNSTGLIAVTYIDDPVVTGVVEGASLTAGTIINSGTFNVFSEAALPTPVTVTTIENSGVFGFSGVGFTLTGDIVNKANAQIDVAGTVTGTATITNSGTLSISDATAASGALAVGAITNSGMLHIAIQSGQENKIVADAFNNTEGVGKITIDGFCDDGVTIVISAQEGDVKVSDITLSVTSQSGGEVTAATHGGSVALVSGIDFDYSTIYLSNGIDEDADFGNVVEDSTDASYYVDFNAFQLPASAFEDGVKDVTTTILLDGSNASALKYESETPAAIDGLAFAKDGTNAASQDDEEKNVELTLTGMDHASPESYRDLKTGITVEAGVALTVDKLRQTGEDAVTNINGELRMGTYNTGIIDDPATPGIDESIGSEAFQVAGGNVNINGGGALYDCTVLSGGSANIYEGGYAEGIAMENGGRLDVNEGGVASAATVNFGGDLYVSDGGKALQVKENGGYVNFDEDDAEVTFVSNTFSGLQLSGLNWATVHSGTTATDITANSRGALQIFSSGLANNVIINSSGKVCVFDGGTVENATVNSGGSFTVSRGGSATGISVLDGARLDLVVAPDTYVQGDYVGSSFELKDASIADYTVKSSCWLGASAGGVASNTTVADGGKLYTFDGGVAIAPTIDVGGVLYLYEDTGSAYEIRENGGAVFGEITENVSFASNTFSGATLEDWREATVHSGTTATDTTISDDGGMYVFDGGVASATIVNSEGVLAIHEGGVASEATVNIGGEICVSSGGMALLIQENGGYVDVQDGANATFVSNTISGLVLDEYKYATVHSGTTATDVSVNSECELEVFSGGIAGDVTVNADGALFIYGGGTANDITVNGSGMAEVSRGGVVDGATVNLDGGLLIFSGAKITGRMTFENGAEVIPFVGSILDFDLTQTSADSVALVNDLSVLLGTPSYTLTVDGTETVGAYKLAGGAAGFNKTITVMNTSGSELGTLDVGTGIGIGGKTYTLTLDDSDLSITIAPGNTPDGGWNDYVYDKKKTPEWSDAYTNDTFVNNPLDEAGDEIFLDEIGAIESGNYHNYLGRKTIGDAVIDDIADFGKITLDTAASLKFTVDSTISGRFALYQVVDGKLKTVKLDGAVSKSVKAGNAAKSTMKNAVLLEAGDYYFGMTANKFNNKAAEIDGFYNAYLTDDSKFFDFADDGWNDTAFELDAKGKEDKTKLNAALVEQKSTLERGMDEIVLDDNVPGNYSNWAGFSDATDYKMFHLDCAANLSLSLQATDKAKLTLWSVSYKNGRYSLTSKGTVSVKAGESKEMKAKLLEAGDYFVSVKSTNAKTVPGGDALYNVGIGADTVFFDSADYDQVNDWAYDKEAGINFNLTKTEVFTPGESTTNVLFDTNEMAVEGFSNFVGHNDKVDYARFFMGNDGTVSFNVTASGAGTFVVYQLNAAKKKLEKLDTIRVTAGQPVSGKTLSLIAGTYFISMTAQSTNAKGNVYYNVEANTDLIGDVMGSFNYAGTSADISFDPLLENSLNLNQNQFALTALADASLDLASDKEFGEYGNGLLASL